MRLRNILFLIGIIGLIVLLLLNHHQLTSFWQQLRHLKWYVLVIIILVQLSSYYINALYYQSILKVFKYKVPVRRLFEGALATNFVNYILPTLGLAGAGYLSQVLQPKVPRGESFLAQLMRYALSGLAVLTLMPLGFILIIFTDNKGPRVVKLAILGCAVVIGLTIGVIYLIEQEKLLRRFAEWIMRRLKHVTHKAKISAADNFVDEFYLGYRAMTKNVLKALPSYAWSIVYILIEMATLYLTFLAFGKAPNPGIIIMAYLLANIASIFGGAVFSFGVFELSMTGTLVALGLSFPLALSATTVYRVMNLIIGLPPGFYYYKKYLPKD